MDLLKIGIRIKRLNLSNDLEVTPANADFSKLGYYDQNLKRFVNAAKPYIGQTVYNEPFSSQHTLKKGVHLHFILPPILTNISNNFSKILPAPNRWLVKRSRGGAITSWAIESDFLSKQIQANFQEDNVSTILPIQPYAKGYAVLEKGTNIYTQPYRFMGRKMSFNDWFTNKYPAENDEYWENLMSTSPNAKTKFTAFAHGDTEFAIFYPNCRGVFGFHDTNGLKGDTYEVVGWYSDGEQLGKNIPLIINFQKFFKKFKKNYSGSDIKADFNAKCIDLYGFQFSNFPKSNVVNNLNQLIFEGNFFELSTETPTDFNDAKVALGGAPGEAISAYLGEEIATKHTNGVQKDKEYIENHLEALQYGFLVGDRLDITPNFEMGRHRRRFKSETGITYFDFGIFAIGNSNNFFQKAKPNEKLAAVLQQLIDSENETFIEFKKNLNKLNHYITKYFQALNRLHQSQIQLHATWQKYLIAAYQPQKVQGATLSSDEILVFIKEKLVPDVKVQCKRIGLLEKTKSGTGVIPVKVKIFTDAKDSNTSNGFVEWDYFSKPYPPSRQKAGTIATAILSALQEIVNNNLKTLNALDEIKNAGLQIGLTNIPGQRYFKPSLPTVLLGGEGLKPISDSAFFEDLSNFPTGSFTTSTDNLKSYLQSISQSGIENQPTPKTLWNPLFLDWKLSFYPVDTDVADDGYTQDYLSNIFDMEPHKAEFSVKTGTQYISKTSTYQGRSMITAYISRFLKAKLDAVKDTDPTGIAKAADEIVSSSGFLVQNFAGLDLEMIQERAALQLAIGDPIAFQDYKNLYESLKIKECVGQNLKISPITDFDFYPIISGGLDLSKLEVINTFGQRHQLGNIAPGTQDIIVPETMVSPPDIHKGGASYLPHAFLYPRYNQPAIMKSHWLNADSETTYNIHSHNGTGNPVFGWVIPNNLEIALDIFNAEGMHYGRIEWSTNQNKIIYIAAPIRENFKPSDVKNKYLRGFVESFAGNTQQDFIDFINIVNTSLELIDPENHNVHRDINYLMGRPMVLVRVGFNFETYGNYPGKKDWAALDKMINDDSIKPITNDFESVEVPVRVGDYTRLNDGVVVYWKDKFQGNNYTPNYSKLYSTIKYYDKINPSLKNKITGNTQQSLTDKPQRLSVLLDPRGAISISTGIVPMQRLVLSNFYYQEVLPKLKIDFPVTPILTPRNKLQINVPNEANFTWNWVQKEIFQPPFLPNFPIPPIEITTITPSHPIIQKNTYDYAQKASPVLNGQKEVEWDNLVQQKILFPDESGEKAFVNTQNILKPLKHHHHGKTTGIAKKFVQPLIQLFNQNAKHIESMVTHTQFGQNELREGWLELEQIPDFINEIYGDQS